MILGWILITRSGSERLEQNFCPIGPGYISIFDLLVTVGILIDGDWRMSIENILSRHFHQRICFLFFRP
jgi:hypothetical protein